MPLRTQPHWAPYSHHGHYTWQLGIFTLCPPQFLACWNMHPLDLLQWFVQDVHPHLGDLVL
jgi:hypothetical protein